MSFVEYFIPYFMYVQLLIIIAAVLSLIAVFRKKLYLEIKGNKLVFSVILIIFAISTNIRLDNMVHPLHISAVNSPDSLFYVQEAKYIKEFGKLPSADIDLINRGASTWPHDPPSIAVLASILQRLGIPPLHSTTILNAALGALSIILIFLFVYLLFDDYMPALVSSIIMAFLPLHLEVSTNGEPFSTSIFFCLLTLITALLFIRLRTRWMLIPLSQLIIFTSQIYYIEIILLVPVFFLISAGRRDFGFSHGTLRINKLFVSLLILLIISVLPFILLQHSRMQAHGVTELSGIWIGTLSKFSSYQCILTRPSKDHLFINSIDNKVLSYASYLFLGLGSKNTYHATNCFRLSGWKTHDYSVREETDSINWITVLTTVIVLLYLFLSRRRKKASYLLLINVFIFILFLSPQCMQTHFYTLWSFILGLLPLISMGIVSINNVIFKKRIYKIVSVILVISLIVSPFFTEHIIERMETNKNLPQTIELSKELGHPIKYSSICNEKNEFINAWKQ